ncbi:RNA polymerase sigma factor, partial [Paraburkholderia dipogonis]|uniref:RNA polymerase sigma factor n=1 Tax=Paraburkholderia dipogonis TaxID=1211383 RepID=UPI0035E895A8
GVERRRIQADGLTPCGDDDASLDIVQDAMISSPKYGDRPAAELPLLFFSVFCRCDARLFPSCQSTQYLGQPLLVARNADDEDFDPLETFEAQQGSAGSETQRTEARTRTVLQLIDDEIQKLPARQREAFLMRYWEDMDVAETAAAMGCSEGSVKTHCSRATHTLAQALKAKGITL